MSEHGSPRTLATRVPAPESCATATLRPPAKSLPAPLACRPAATAENCGRTPGCGWFAPENPIGFFACREWPETNRKGSSRQPSTGRNTVRFGRPDESLRHEAGQPRVCGILSRLRRRPAARALRQPPPTQTFRSTTAQRSLRAGLPTKIAQLFHADAALRAPEAAPRY